ncbi:MAG: tRNA (adenosine(37)-N6)-threonylcarbamoyltransferase complex dimerization subunit type 1 TsaB [Candidatus Methylumidiphilus sp.]
MKLLALETSTEACSAALYCDGEVAERYQIAPREHNKLILPMAEALLAEAGLSLGQLDALAFGRGPGSFTGVRIATGVVQGLALGADLPVAPVSTLAAMAQEAFAETASGFAFPCIDARMGEVYWAVYRRGADGDAQLQDAEAVAAATDVAFGDDAVGHGIGSGWGTYADALRGRLGESRVVGVLAGRFPRAAWIARLGAEVFRRGGCVAAEDAQPVYLRDKVAKKTGGAY